jgi:hypothetical protein
VDHDARRLIAHGRVYADLEARLACADGAVGEGEPSLNDWIPPSIAIDQLFRLQLSADQVQRSRDVIAGLPDFSHLISVYLDGCAYGYSRWVESLQTKHIHSKIVRSDTLAVKGVNAANLAEVVSRRSRMKLVLSQRRLASKNLEVTFVDPDHQRVLLRANGTSAGRQFFEVGLDLKLHGATVAASFQHAHQISA